MGERKTVRRKLVTAEKALALFRKNDLEPVVPFPGSQKPWKSRCKRTKKIVFPTYGKVRDFGHRCIYCSRGVIEPRAAMKLMRTNGFIPQVPFPGTNTPWKSRCSLCKKITSPTYWNVAKGTGCKFCAKRAVDPLDAAQVMKSRGFTVLESFPGATTPWKVRCDSCKREFTTTFHSLSTSNRCRYCQRSELDPAEIERVLKSLYLIPLEKYPGASYPWKLKCKRCQKIFERKYEKLTRKDGKVHGCSYCSRKRVDPAEAVALMKKFGVTPLVAYPGANKPWKCRCMKCKNIVYPRWGDVGQGQGACSNCADYGLNYSLPGYLYLITNSELNSHKVGIANTYKSRTYDDRMYQHKKRGWVLYKKKSFATLRQAQQVEKSFLRWLRLEMEIPVHLSRTHMSQGGWTETFESSEIDLPTVWKKVEELSRNRG